MNATQFPADPRHAERDADPDPAVDPSEAFRQAVEDAETAVREATAAVQVLRTRFRLLDKDIKAREKRCLRFEKTIASLQQASGF